MANFEAFCRVISSSVNLLFLKSLSRINCDTMPQAANWLEGALINDLNICDFCEKRKLLSVQNPFDLFKVHNNLLGLGNNLRKVFFST